MAGETQLTERDSVKRKDSGMSGISRKSPEAAAPKIRDFGMPARHHPDKENMGVWRRLKGAIPTTLSGGKF